MELIFGAEKSASPMAQYSVQINTQANCPPWQAIEPHCETSPH
jgi:hypothetical protein